MYKVNTFFDKHYKIVNSVTSIGNYAFYSCSALEKIYSLNSVAPVCGSAVFDQINSSIPVYIPKGAGDNYYWEEGWDYFYNFIETDFAGVEDNEITNNEIKVIEGNGIEISDYYGRIRIVNLAGQVVKDVYVDGYIQLSLPKGIYIVVTENNSQKVIL